MNKYRGSEVKDAIRSLVERLASNDKPWRRTLENFDELYVDDSAVNLAGLSSVWCWSHAASRTHRVLATVVERAEVARAKRLTHVCIAAGATLVAQVDGAAVDIGQRLIINHLAENGDVFPEVPGEDLSRLSLGWSETSELWTYGSVLGGALAAGLLIPSP